MSLDKIIKIKITGSNVNNYLKRVIRSKINFIKVIPISKKEVDIILRYSEYEKLMECRSVYKIVIVEKLGILRFKEIMFKNKILLLFLVLGLFLIYNLSNMVFRVEVIHHDKNIRELVMDELYKHGIKKYTFRKSYEELEVIEDRILDSNKDFLEWLEISVDGTYLLVRVEERLINDEKKNSQYQSIVSKKNAVIKRINAYSGEVVKEEDTFVKKGDVIISGYITKPDNTNVLTIANGEVIGEVWYEVDIDYPFVYQESNLTGKSKRGITINFFDRKINLFSKEEYRSFSSKDKLLFRDNFLDLEVIYEKRYELDIRDEVYTEELVESRAVSYIKDKMMRDNPDIEKLSDVKVLSREVDHDSIRFRFFVTAMESIGEVLVIEENVEEELNT